MKHFLSVFITIFVLVSCQNTSTQSKQEVKLAKPTIATQPSEKKIKTAKKLKSKEYTWLNEPLYLLGYQNSKPVFKSWKTTNLYQLNDTLELLTLYADTLKAIYIDDNMIIYSGPKSMIIDTEIEVITLQTESAVLDATATPNGRDIYFLTDYNKPIEILDLSTIQTEKTELVGWNISIHNDFIYYVKNHPEISGFVKLYRSPLSDLNQQIELLQGAFGEGMTFFPSDSILGIHANLKTDIRPAVYNFVTKKYAFIDGVKSELKYPVLLPRTKQLGYYTIKNFQNQFFELNFDFKNAEELGISE